MFFIHRIKATANKFLNSHPSFDQNWGGEVFIFLTALKNRRETFNALKLNC